MEKTIFRRFKKIYSINLSMQGNFELKNARMKPEYLTNFMKQDTDYPRHRMIHMVKKNIEGTDDLIIRACINLEFTVIF